MNIFFHCLNAISQQKSVSRCKALKCFERKR